MITYVECPKMEGKVCNDLSVALNEIKLLKLKLEPRSVHKGGVCQAVLSFGTTCAMKPEKELFVPSLSPKPFVLCDVCCKEAMKTFYSLGIFYKSYAHESEEKQGKLFEVKS